MSTECGLLTDGQELKYTSCRSCWHGLKLKGFGQPCSCNIGTSTNTWIYLSLICVCACVRAWVWIYVWKFVWQLKTVDTETTNFKGIELYIKLRVYRQTDRQ